MSEQQAASAALRGGPGRRLTRVDDYVGRPGLEAAQAIRRAGLCPGLERTFGCAPELIGQVVGQEPAAGSMLARDGVVSIYVAAGGSEPAGEESSGIAAERAQLALQVDPRRAAASGEEAHVERGPEPVGSAPGGSSEAASEATVERGGRTRAVDGVAAADEADVSGRSEHADGTAERAGEEFVVRADDLFAGRFGASRPGWRRLYPREGRATRRRTAGSRRWLARGVWLLLSVWALAGAGSALIGGRSEPAGSRSNGSGGGALPAHRLRTPASSRRLAGRSRDGRARAGRPAGAKVMRGERPRAAAGTPALAVPQHARRQLPRRVLVVVVVVHEPPAPVPDLEVAPAEEQMGGGPFSP
jgi:hypothetical protein